MGMKRIITLIICLALPACSASILGFTPRQRVALYGRVLGDAGTIANFAGHPEFGVPAKVVGGRLVKRASGK